MEAVSRVRPDIAVVGAAAHIATMRDFEMVIREVVSQHQTFHPDLVLIWKTSQPGGCELWPLDEPPSAARDYWQTYQGVQYNWALFEAFDDTVRTHLANTSLSAHNIHILDLAPLHLRPDAHPGSRPSPLLEKETPSGSPQWKAEKWKTDCLHMCTPGPLDIVPRFLLHLLARVLQ